MPTHVDPPTPFADRLARAVAARHTPVLVGLDPRYEELPAGMEPLGTGGATADWVGKAVAYRRFCEAVIDVVAPLVAVVKPQAAFFEELGPPGMTALKDVIDYARAKGLLVILDGKRNDIGSTAAAYATGYLGSPALSAWAADALTVSPYLGADSLEPFIDVAQRRAPASLCWSRRRIPAAACSRICSSTASRFTRMSPRKSTGGRGRQNPQAAMAPSEPSSARPIPTSSSACGPCCHTPGSWSPAMAAKGPAQAMFAERSTSGGKERSSTVPAPSFSPTPARNIPSGSAPPAGKTRSKRPRAI